MIAYRVEALTLMWFSFSVPPTCVPNSNICFQGIPPTYSASRIQLSETCKDSCAWVAGRRTSGHIESFPL
ncbi:hypothetical protein M404DRAFT_812625 [Pisolithus tinctorius Marx 270]|uniref:Uncharacterized protein n=1 Tax=Pisolithus tinctorius Marx 270 TaxID=870435 RepID=A0A0C3NE52_PISTI|nr:hypothetical protein M404DRAFT_812625 [Pisolithus tinctorius Marx 270]